MSVPILVTKLYIPSTRPDLVARPCLIDRLNAGLRGKLTLVSAPAGFGKTSLLSAWIEQTKRPVAWVSLDEDDNDAARFLVYVIAALQTIDAEIGASVLAGLQSPQPPPPLSVLPYLISDIASYADITLVLDDYHVIKTQAVHDLVDYLLQHMPRNLHLIIATRTDPPLPLPRLRGRRQLTELRTADLRFSHAAAEAFFNQVKALQLSSEDVMALNGRTEGWITGLQMALLSMQGREDKSRFIQSFTGSNRYILDYLLEEVLEQQPAEMRDFLLKTSLLDRLCGELCRAVTGDSASQQMLEKMERTNLFVIPLDDQRGWFRYHHLFADLLRQRLSLVAPDSVPALHCQASLWYEQNYFLTQAIEHALAANDNQKAIQLIGKYIESIWEHGDQTRLTRWLTSLPEDEISQHPLILTHHAFALCFSGQFDAAEAQLELAGRSTNTNQKLFAGTSATVRAYASLYGNEIEAAADYAKLALDHLVPDQHMWRSLALSIHGDVNAFYGHVPTCEEIWGSALCEAEKTGNIFFALMGSAKVIVAQKRLGRLRQAARTFEEQTRRAFDGGYTQMSVAGALYAVFGDILLEWNRVEEAVEHIRRGLNLSERQNYAAGVAWSCISTIQAHFSQGDLVKAEAALRHLETRIQKNTLPGWTMNWFTAWQVRLLLMRGNFDKAGRVLQGRGISLDGEFAYPNEVEYLALARLLIAQDDFTAAESLLTRLHAYLNTKGWVDKLIEVLILQALIYRAQGKEDMALERLAATLTLAEPEGYMQRFIQEGPAMACLLYKAVEANIAPVYCGRLLAAFPATGEQPSDPKSQADLIEPLSPREQDVLQLIARGATNQETALALHIAPGTVKNHLKNIYDKLNVHSRTQAAARARDLGLLD